MTIITMFFSHCESILCPSFFLLDRCKEVTYCSLQCLKWDWQSGGHADRCIDIRGAAENPDLPQDMEGAETMATIMAAREKFRSEHETQLPLPNVQKPGDEADTNDDNRDTELEFLQQLLREQTQAEKQTKVQTPAHIQQEDDAMEKESKEDHNPTGPIQSSNSNPLPSHTILTVNEGEQEELESPPVNDVPRFDFELEDARILSEDLPEDSPFAEPEVLLNESSDFYEEELEEIEYVEPSPENERNSVSDDMKAAIRAMQELKLPEIPKPKPPQQQTVSDEMKEAVKAMASFNFGNAFVEEQEGDDIMEEEIIEEEIIEEELLEDEDVARTPTKQSLFGPGSRVGGTILPGMKFLAPSFGSLTEVAEEDDEEDDDEEEIQQNTFAVVEQSLGDEVDENEHADNKTVNVSASPDDIIADSSGNSKDERGDPDLGLPLEEHQSTSVSTLQVGMESSLGGNVDNSSSDNLTETDSIARNDEGEDPTPGLPLEHDQSESVSMAQVDEESSLDANLDNPSENLDSQSTLSGGRDKARTDHDDKDQTFITTKNHDEDDDRSFHAEEEQKEEETQPLESKVQQQQQQQQQQPIAVDAHLTLDSGATDPPITSPSMQEANSSAESHGNSKQNAQSDSAAPKIDAVCKDDPEPQSPTKETMGVETEDTHVDTSKLKSVDVNHLPRPASREEIHERLVADHREIHNRQNSKSSDHSRPSFREDSKEETNVANDGGIQSGQSSPNKSDENPKAATHSKSLSVWVDFFHKEIDAEDEVIPDFEAPVEFDGAAYLRWVMGEEEEMQVASEDPDAAPSATSGDLDEAPTKSWGLGLLFPVRWAARRIVAKQQIKP